MVKYNIEVTYLSNDIERTINVHYNSPILLNEEEKNNKKIELLTKEFQEKVLETTHLAGEQLYERYNFQKTALAKQFPFMRSNNLWKELGEKDGNDEVGDTINTGSLSIGFVGGANAMYALFDAEHGTSEVAYNVLYDTIEKMGKVADEFRVVARASDGVVEAIEHKTYKFLVAVQWHPEMLAVECEKARELFVRFIEEAKNIGIIGYIVKPIDEKSFIPNLEIIFNKQEEFEELEKKYLKIKELIPVLEVEQVAFLSNGQIFEYSKSRHRGDKTEIKMIEVR